ncbi:MAG TPA: Gfo/Idh/MocA family oxidoreductase [Burkholderiales bacterium]|nr:Gfo/Idh/MocA family oxidoreductase [Burkholderiales bacterium]
MKAERLSVAIIGAGHMGRYHAEKFARLPGVELAAVVDRDPARAKISDFRPILDKVEAAVVAVPTNLHHEVARACLEKGVHVLIEKPITSTLDEANALVDLAAQKNLVLQVGHVERYNKAFRALVERMDRPLFIDAERLSGFKQRGAEVDVILDLMIHDLDLALSLARSEVAQVSACGFRVLTNDIDIASVRIEFANGCVADLTASRASQAAVRKFRVFQPGVYVSADLQAGKLRYVRQADGVIEETEEAHTGGDALAAQAESFILAITKNRPVLVDGVEGRRVLKLALDIGRLVRERLARFE